MTTTTNRITSINSSQRDYTNSEGVRVCVPIYLDLTNLQRKTLLSAARSLATECADATPHTQSGIVVSNTTGGLNRLEAYLGCSFDLLRSALFQRGGLAADLVIKLQLATGVEVISLKEIEAGIKAKIALVKDYVAQNPFNG
jgi:hypothetical protein